MDYAEVGWTVDDQTGNMQHVKTCAVSHYLATDGTEHKNAIFFTSANLDEIDYRGRNGNGRSQSGVVVSDHEDLFRCTLNYVNLMYEYSHKEGLQEFRKIVMDRNREQAALFRSGKANEIPKSEQILYLGSDTDKVFKLYFTPLDSPVDTWDVVNNPICEYVDKLPQSEGYIECAWNEFGFSSNCYMGVAIGQILEQAYCENPNPKNKFSAQVTGLNTGKMSSLKVGTEIGAYKLEDGYDNTHTKDFLLNYVEDGVRHKVSILTSCNYGIVTFFYRTNSILVIDETAETGGTFYDTLIKKFTGGTIS